MFNFFFLCASLFYLSACTEQKSPSDIQKIIDKGTLVVAVYTEDMHPFFMSDEKGVLIGVDIDLANSVAKDLGVKAVFVRDSKTFDDMIEKVEKGEADLGVSKLSYTSKRANKILYSKPYITTHASFLCSRLFLKKISKDKNYNNINDILRNKDDAIHVYSGSSYVALAKKLFPASPIQEHKSDEALLEYIESGKGLCALRDEFAVKGYLAKFPENNPYTFEVVLNNEADPFYVVITPKSPHLVERVNKIIDKTKSNRDVNELLEQHKKYIKEKRKQ